MRAPPPLLLLLLGICSAPGLCLGGARDELLFKTWMSQNNRQYGSEEEYWQRLQVFMENKRRIDRHNAGNHTFQLGLNQFADMTFAEFQKKYLWQEPQNCSATKGNFVSGAGLSPSTIDWRKKGNYVTPVKNQGPCGSCWTFSTTGCLESAIAIQTGKLLNLAEQQLVDCAQDFNNHGCSGGLPSQAFEYILYNRGLMGEDSYPYRAKNGTCHFQPQKAIAFVKDVVNITLYDEQGLVEAVGRFNPVSFAFEVVGDFMFYKQGVYSSTKCQDTPDKVNHAVLAVGYGEENGVPYWIVKNSWGPSWGMDGYFYIERGKNMCGLAACASFPVPLV
ncbi:pro-cathepsin H [Tiliqua scincoides]|uniref:pro-cathepsin H n=1 Tax=Tiliqua scincoides TaxID=71010 RepID=UPI003463404F